MCFLLSAGTDFSDVKLCRNACEKRVNLHFTLYPPAYAQAHTLECPTCGNMVLSCENGPPMALPPTLHPQRGQRSGSGALHPADSASGSSGTLPGQRSAPSQRPRSAAAAAAAAARMEERRDGWMDGGSDGGVEGWLAHSPRSIFSGCCSAQQLAGWCCESAPSGGSFPLLDFLWRRTVMVDTLKPHEEDMSVTTHTYTYKHVCIQLETDRGRTTEEAFPLIVSQWGGIKTNGEGSWRETEERPVHCLSPFIPDRLGKGV